MKTFTWGELWAAVVVVAGVVAAVVGFIVHALTVRKSTLEIEKLKIEIAQKRREESPIRIATIEEMERYVHNAPPPLGKQYHLKRRPLGGCLMPVIVGVIFLIVFLVLRHH